VGRFGDVARCVRDSHDDLVANLDNLEPTLRALPTPAGCGLVLLAAPCRSR